MHVRQTDNDVVILFKVFLSTAAFDTIAAYPQTPIPRQNATPPRGGILKDKYSFMPLRKKAMERALLGAVSEIQISEIYDDNRYDGWWKHAFDVRPVTITVD